MKTIRIRIKNNDMNEVAMRKVISVIHAGLISQTKKYGKQYCFATSFNDKTVVRCEKFDKGITFTVLDMADDCGGLPNPADQRAGLPGSGDKS